jgi:hypothetical protein
LIFFKASVVIRMPYLYNMKKLLFGFICVWFAQTASAQKDSLQTDEADKYVYYKVVDKAGLTADTLYNRGRAFIKAADVKVDAGKAAANTLNGKAKFVVYNGVSVMKKESGVINYTLFIETKDGKYRYKLSDFVFTPYTRDRFNNMVPVDGIEIPIEKLETKYSKKEAADILNQTGKFSQATGNNITAYMNKLSNIKKAEPIKKVATDKW